MELLKALEIISKDNTKKAVNEDCSYYIFYANNLQKIICENGEDFIVDVKSLSTDWNIQDINSKEIQNYEFIYQLNSKLGTSYKSIYEIDFSELIEENTYRLNENIIEKLIEIFEIEIDKNILEIIICCQNVSCNFLKKYSIKFSKRLWHLICKYQNLTEEFMDEFAENLDWSTIVYNQKMSENFVLKHKDRLCLGSLIDNQDFSLDFWLKNIDLLEDCDIKELVGCYPEFVTLIRDYVKTLN